MTQPKLVFTKYNRRATGENLINLLNANEYKWFKSDQIVVQMGWEHIQQHTFNCTFSQRTISYRLYVTMRKIYRYHSGYNFKIRSCHTSKKCVSRKIRGLPQVLVRRLRTVVAENRRLKQRLKIRWTHQ